MRDSMKNILGSVALSGGLVCFAGCQAAQRTYPLTPPVVSQSPQASADVAPAANPLGSGAAPAPIAPPAPTPPAAAAKPPPENPVTGGQVLSDGPYPPPAFPAPSQPGQLIVVDDASPTVAIAQTTVLGADAGKMMSITDVPGIAVNLDKTHKYSVIFVPLKTGAP
jgi:hypothetical protein